jgi:hypothetical protein
LFQRVENRALGSSPTILSFGMFPVNRAEPSVSDPNRMGMPSPLRVSILIAVNDRRER